MAHLVFFVLLFAGQLTGGFSTQKLTPSDNRETLTVLSIDGGGIKGIIPATVLDYLDKALKAKDPNADLAHYFEVIGGTGTGGLIAAMLASPSPDDATRAAFTPAQIVDFYKQNGPHIFNESRPGNGPKFDGEFLHNVTRELLKDTRLSQTLTNVVIPAFDLKRQKPVIFSNYKLENVPYLDALLSDICISTSATPTQLPPYYFQNDGVEFNMSNFFDARLAAFWTEDIWAAIATDMQGRASSAMAKYYPASLFSRFPPSTSTYLRIDEYDLNPDFSNSVNVTEENLEGLEKTGKQLLQEKVVKMNLDTFNIEEGVGTNAEALDRIADILHGERQRRLERKSMKKGGRPFLETLAQANWAFQKNIS
ncbi:Patatin-17 protein [Vigna angularis]|uniref:Patatin n=1 Tax=Phaseolus angularis TaxID=3914 RepID=A0A8T0JSK1_PHAAN|nr:Patatin-17 protein [Vigna angularis]